MWCYLLPWLQQFLERLFHCNGAPVAMQVPKGFLPLPPCSQIHVTSTCGGSTCRFGNEDCLLSRTLNQHAHDINPIVCCSLRCGMQMVHQHDVLIPRLTETCSQQMQGSHVPLTECFLLIWQSCLDSAQLVAGTAQNAVGSRWQQP